MKPALAVGAVFVAIVLMPMIIIAAIAGSLLPAATTAMDCTGPVASMAGSWRPPLTGRYVQSSGFGMRYHPVLHTTKLHTGIDLVATTGSKMVVAAAAGSVAARGYNTAYGNQVLIDHGGGIQTRYAHMAAPTAVSTGQRISAGTRLGTQGATGYVTGAHLHFEIVQHGRPIDPKPFMARHGAPLNGHAVTPTAGADALPTSPQVKGGLGFDLPKAASPRKESLTRRPLPIPAKIKQLYRAAADTYKIPWTLLAGIGMEETGHGRTRPTSSAGARGLMQFMPETWDAMGVDGDKDGRADITDPADSVFSAANYLTKSGVSKGPAGVRRALLAYNHADWYANDVLYYANAYGVGTVLGGVEDCGTGTSTGNPGLPPLTDERLQAVLGWAERHDGDAYVFGGSGPHAWDCASFVQAAFHQVDIAMPRTAGAQRDWLAQGNGYRVKPGNERPGDLIFWDSFLGPNQVGHVAIVWNPAGRRTIDARNSRLGVGHFTYSPAGKHIFEIWRAGNSDPSP